MARTTAVVFVCLLAASITPSFAQSCPTPLGHWGYRITRCRGLVQESWQLIPSGPKLLVVDFRLGAPRSIVGEVRLPGIAIALEVQGDTAYAGIRQPPIAAEELLVAIDLSEPSNPVTLGRIAIARAMSDVAVHGSVAYVTSLSEGLVLVDVSDPSEMRRLSSIPSIKSADSVVARGQHAYLGTWQGLRCSAAARRPTKRSSGGQARSRRSGKRSPTASTRSVPPAARGDARPRGSVNVASTRGILGELEPYDLLDNGVINPPKTTLAGVDRVHAYHVMPAGTSKTASILADLERRPLTCRRGHDRGLARGHGGTRSGRDWSCSWATRGAARSCGSRLLLSEQSCSPKVPRARAGPSSRKRGSLRGRDQF